MGANHVLKTGLCRCSASNGVLAFHFFGPTLTCLLIACVYYMRNSNLRAKMKQEGLDWLARGQ
jgi:hypothetical protein